MGRTKVAVLGGGLGSIAAAFELSATAELRERFEVTVYQQGFRLGGKGASGRSQAHGERIEEHGLHAFLGFYEHAFAFMRDLYAEWARVDPQARWTSWADAFEPQRMLSLAEWVPEQNRYLPWNVTLPRLPGEPGDGVPVPLLERLVVGAVGLLIEWLEQLVAWDPRAFVELGRHAAALAITEAEALKRPEVMVTLTALREALRRWEGERSLADDVRRLVLSAELGVAIVTGLVSEVVPRGPEAGFAYIDQWDFKAWLERHGASPRVSFWGPVRALYDLGFAYEDGVSDVDHARAAAGVALRILLLLGLGYKDAPLWKMRAGMGDTIFAPAYRVLEARGVRLQLFRRVKNLGLSATKNLVERIDLSRQVDVLDGYRVLRDVAGLPCWPDEPDWEHVRDGAKIRDRLAHDGLTLESAWCLESAGTETLQLGRDFDRVVVGISVAALRDVAPELLAARPAWTKMVAATKTVQTRALQLWLDRDTEALGWTAGRTVLTGFVETFDTWADMTHLLPVEAWPAPAPKSLAYFCNVMPDAPVLPPFTDPTFPGSQLALVRDTAVAYLQDSVCVLWPRAAAPGTTAFDWSILHDPAGGVGTARLDAQFMRANIDPTERYVLSVPGSLVYRLSAGDAGFVNVVVAGDWVETSLNAGCAEAAVEGGLRAAHALIGYAPRPFAEARLVP